MDLNKHASGKGIDVSRIPVIKKAKHYYLEPNNFYSLKKTGKPENFDFVYSKNLVNATKFFKVLIKEWFYACKINGRIIIDIKSNKLLNFNELIKECNLLLGDKIEIIDTFYKTETKEGILVLKKIKPALKRGDSINKWSFGILTNGKRDEWVDKEIKSILDLKIPNLEIIICGNYNNKNNYPIKRIDFNPEIAWITKKKNMIAEKAKYENIVITHDRYVFDKNWFEGMKRYGNYFEILSCVIRDPNGDRTDEWITFGTDLNAKILQGNQGWLEYRDWDFNSYIDGGLYIIKKSVWERCQWDNSLMWAQREDILLSRDYLNAGFVSRFNPDSSCKTHTIKRKWPIYKFNSQKLGKIQGQKFSHRMLYIFKKYILKKHYFVIRDCYYVLKEYYGK
jgi:hypothetical protein